MPVQKPSAPAQAPAQTMTIELTNKRAKDTPDTGIAPTLSRSEGDALSPTGLDDDFKMNDTTHCDMLVLVHAPRKNLNKIPAKHEIKLAVWVRFYR